MSCNADHRTRSGPALFLLLSIGLVVGYPLSAGPACLLYRVMGSPDGMKQVLSHAYSPLSSIPGQTGDMFDCWCMHWYELPGAAQP